MLRDHQGRVLVARRPPGAELGGLWEFPGGKAESGERPRDALARELEEELGVGVELARPLVRVGHDTSARRVLLDVWEILAYRGSPVGREGQPLRWVPAQELTRWPMPPADGPVITALRLPPVLCDADGEAAPDLVSRTVDPTGPSVARSATGGFAVVGPIRGERGIGWARFASMVAHLHGPVYAQGGVCAADAAVARALGGHGVIVRGRG
ncbi:MAG: NUDIX domain-containing protein [Chromatiales bacterium]|nr:NUDIX domain-containing protein [Chromatiales bacterium]